MLKDVPIFSLAMGKMRYAAEAQKVAAENIAQADIPNAKAMEIEKFPFKTIMARQASGGGLEPTRTNAMHMAGSKSDTHNFKTFTQKDTYEVNPNGNNIILEEQMLKSSGAKRDNKFATDIYRRFSNFMKMAVGGGTS